MLRTGQVLMQVEIQTEEQEQSEYFSTISPHTPPVKALIRIMPSSSVPSM